MQPNRAKYVTLINVILKQIENGTLKQGDKLPSVRNLAFDMQVTPGTVARAYKELIDQNILEARVGDGTFVREYKAAVSHTPSDQLYLLSPRLPDIGQVAILRRGFIEFGNSAGFNELMAYPQRMDTATLQASYLRFIRDVPLGQTTAQDVVVTHGGQHGGVTALQAIRQHKQGDVITEDLSYPGFRHAAELSGTKLRPVATDIDGPIPEHFEQILRSHKISAFFTSAQVNNPTLRQTSNERRHILVDLCRKHDVDIVEDDCYRIGAYQGMSYRAIYPDGAWYVTSFSKSISPALRIGCVVCPENMADHLRNIVFFNSLGVSQATCRVAEYVMNHPRIAEIQVQIANETNRYIQAAVNVLGQFDIAWRDAVPMLWLQLPRGWRAAAFCQAAKDRGVLITPADAFTVRDGNAPQAVRISLNAEHGLDRFNAGIETLANLLRTPPAVEVV